MTATDIPTPVAPAATIQVVGAPATPRARTARPPVNVVNARPVAAALANAATIAGATLVHVGGVGALAVAAGAAATAAGAGAVSKARSRRQSTGTMRRAASPRTAGSRPSLGSPGGRSAGLPKLGGSGRSAGAGRAGSSRGSHSWPKVGVPSTRRSSGGGSAAGRSATGRPSSGGRPTASGKRTGLGSFLPGRGRSSSGTPGGGFRKAGSAAGSGARRTPLSASRVAAARRRIDAKRNPGPRFGDVIRSATAPAPGSHGRPPTARQAWSNARRAVTGANPKRRGPYRRAAAGLAAAGLAAGKAAWDAHRRRKKAAAARQAKTQRATGRPATNKPGVGRTVRRPAGQQQRGPITNQTTTAPAAKPSPTNRSGRTPVTTGGTTVSVKYMRDLAEEFLRAAARDEPEGMLQVVGEAHQMPDVLDLVAKAMQLRYQAAQEHPIAPQIKQMYAAVHKAQMAVVEAAREIGPAIERLHKEELERLRNPRLRGDESKWDVTKNRDAA